MTAINRPIKTPCKKLEFNNQWIALLACNQTQEKNVLYGCEIPFRVDLWNIIDQTFGVSFFRMQNHIVG